MSRPVALCILDGWGLSDRPEGNAPLLADTPVMDRLVATCPHATLTTHGPDAGLPRGQMGNSEVGHTNIGAGRVVAMDLGQIDLAIEDGRCFSSRWRKVRIVVSSGIRSLISSMPAKRRMVGVSIRASSIAGSLSEYHCCSR